MDHRGRTVLHCNYIFQTLRKHEETRNGSQRYNGYTMEAQVEETVMTHCASSGVLLVWIMALPPHHIHTTSTSTIPYLHHQNQHHTIFTPLLKTIKHQHYTISTTPTPVPNHISTPPTPYCIYITNTSTMYTQLYHAL